MSEQRCGTCKWFRELYDSGDCEYPLPQWVKLTVDRLYGTAFPFDPMNVFTMNPDDGKDCPTWHAK